MKKNQAVIIASIAIIGIVAYDFYKKTHGPLQTLESAQASDAATIHPETANVGIGLIPPPSAPILTNTTGVSNAVPASDPSVWDTVSADVDLAWTSALPG